MTKERIEKELLKVREQLAGLQARQKDLEEQLQMAEDAEKMKFIEKNKISLERLILLNKVSEEERREAPNSAAAPKPAIPMTFSVPLRKPFSCPPPKMTGVSAFVFRIFSLTKSAPTPFGPPILCALMLTESAWGSGLCMVFKKP